MGKLPSMGIANDLAKLAGCKTPYELAKRCQIPRSTIYKFEESPEVVQLKILQLVADTFDLKLDDVFDVALKNMKAQKKTKRKE